MGIVYSRTLESTSKNRRHAAKFETISKLPTFNETLGTISQLKQDNLV